MTFLDEVLEGVRQSLDAGYYDVPEDMKPERPQKTEGKSLQTALRKQFGIIAEIKPRSPTAGVLYQSGAAELAQTYANGGAAALSVLCEKSRFDGRLENLRAAKTAGLPVLAKDFVVSQRQLQAYAAHGADAALLIFEVFERKKADMDLDDAIEAVHQNGLDVLLEVHSADALIKAMETDADVIGINNRNLDDLSLNVLHFQNVLSESGVELDASKAAGKPIIAESGFETAADVQLARDAGLDGVLIGTGLLKNADPADALKKLVKPA